MIEVSGSFTSQNLLHMLRQDEGLKLVVYDDANGLPIRRGSQVVGNATIGIGRCITDRNGITESEAYYLLANDIARINARLAMLSWWVNLDPVRKDVVTAMAFQLGLEGMLTFKTFITCLIQKNWVLASHAMLDSTWAHQTPARVQRMANTIVTGVSYASFGD